MTPWDYAQRYLSVTVHTEQGNIPVSIRRYHLGAPTAAQFAVWSALDQYLITKQKKNPGYRQPLQVNGNSISIGNVGDIARSLKWPFYGKGSPEDCQIVLQAAVIAACVSPANLQAWADDNLGLDGNGIVGNYLWHDVLGNPWNNITDGEPGPDALITDIFRWAAGEDEGGAIDDVSQITLHDKYLIARVDGDGTVKPGGLNHAVGHIAVTQPGELLKGPILIEGTDLDAGEAGLTLTANCAVRTVESGGFPAGRSDGVGRNWMTFKRKAGDKVFVVTRDRLAVEDLVKIAPIRKGRSW
jgi:hypothetical protein